MGQGADGGEEVEFYEKRGKFEVNGSKINEKWNPGKKLSAVDKAKYTARVACDVLVGRFS